MKSAVSVNRYQWVLLMLLALCGLQNACADEYEPENTENWAVNSAWVKELPILEQEVVLVSLGLAVSTHVDTKLIPAVKSRRDMQWVLKVAGTSNAMLVPLATNSPQIRAFYESRSKVYLDAINGKIDADEFERVMAEITRKMEQYTARISKEQIDQVRRKYRARLLDTETALIAFSKLRVQ